MDKQRVETKQRHGIDMLKQLETMRTSHEWSLDCNIRVERKTFEVHRVVIAGASKFFREKLKPEVRQHGREQRIQITLQEVTAVAVEQCLNFVYTGSAELTSDNIIVVLEAADKFKLDVLIDFCLHTMLKYITPRNCFSARRWYKKFGFFEEEKNVLDFINKNINHVLIESEFLNITREEISGWLKETNSHDFAFLWRVITTWTNFVPDERNLVLPDLLAPYSQYFPVEYLISVLEERRSATRSQKDRILSDCFKQKIAYGEFCYLTNTISVSRDKAFEQPKKILKIVISETPPTPELSFISLSKESMLFVIDSWRTSTVSLRTIWEFVLKWTKHSEARGNIFPQLFESINLERFDVKLLKTMISEPLIQRNQKCLQRVQSRIRYFSSPEDAPSVSKRSRLDGDMSTFHTNARSNYGCHTLKAECCYGSKKETNAHNDGEKYFIAMRDSCSEYLLGMNVITGEISRLSKIQMGSYFQAIVSMQEQLYMMRDQELKKRNENKRWKTLSKLQRSPSRDAKLVASSHHIYLVEQRVVSEYDPITNTWDIRTVNGITGSEFCVCACDNVMYILGGRETPRRALVYDRRTHKTVEIQQMICARVQSAAVFSGNKVFVIGGSKNPEDARLLEFYDVSTRRWQGLQPMELSRWDLSVCAHENKIYAIGGRGKSQKSTSSMEIYEYSKSWYVQRLRHHLVPPFTACVTKTSII